MLAAAAAASGYETLRRALDDGSLLAAMDERALTERLQRRALGRRRTHRR